MKRYCSHLTFCSPDKILKQAVIEQNGQHMITDLFQLSERQSESSGTVFLDGIISAVPISIKQNFLSEDLIWIQNKYRYIDLSTDILTIGEYMEGKPLLLDFSTDSIADINKLILQSLLFLSSCSIWEIITACVYLPAFLSGRQAELEINSSFPLIVWQGVDLSNRRITERTRIVSLS